MPFCGDAIGTDNSYRFHRIQWCVNFNSLYTKLLNQLTIHCLSHKQWCALCSTSFNSTNGSLFSLARDSFNGLQLLSRSQFWLFVNFGQLLWKWHSIRTKRRCPIPQQLVTIRMIELWSFQFIVQHFWNFFFLCSS